MHQSFTGSARRTRQVNLSGRNANPFGAPSGGQWVAQGVSGPQQTLANAQQERLARQKERERLESAQRIQRSWRSWSTKEKLRNELRNQWDSLDAESATPNGPTSPMDLDNVNVEEPTLEQVTLLPRFANLQASSDLSRLQALTKKLLKDKTWQHKSEGGGRWSNALQTLQRLYLRAISLARLPESTLEEFLSVLNLITRSYPEFTTQISGLYYKSLSACLHLRPEWAGSPSSRANLAREAFLLPFYQQEGPSRVIYESFVRYVLTSSELHNYFGDLEAVAKCLDFDIVSKCLSNELDSASKDHAAQELDSEKKLWLLAYLICLHKRQQHLNGRTSTSDAEYITIVSTLLQSLAESIIRRMNAEDSVSRSINGIENVTPSGLRTRSGKSLPLPAFVREQIESLADQQSVTGLLSYANGSSRTSTPQSRQESLADSVAGYALALLRIFPRKADEIRMWLYMGYTANKTKDTNTLQERTPAVKYLWQSSKDTRVFRSVFAKPRAALEMLKYPGQNTPSGFDHEWRVILLFLELYGFVLRVMDDEEFFSPVSRDITISNGSGSQSWTRESALALKDVESLAVCLKNLAFALYWYASEISGVATSTQIDDIRAYFNQDHSSQLDESAAKSLESKTNSSLGGIAGLTVDHMKGIVTGILRMIYERDSRRNFLPSEFWLMTSFFDMESFITAVVAEDENRNQVQNDEDEDDVAKEEEDHEDQSGTDTTAVETSTSGGLIGNHQARRTQNVERRRKQQLRTSRTRFLEAVTPRLEIMQNMPFFIPFATRVQIFRRFVHMDQYKRRSGNVDPDQWRASIVHQHAFGGFDTSGPGADILRRHQARIRRESLFEDAFDQFYELGDGLKEPIQITFIDAFGTVEAGIDGGGVTKEFLTSVTNQAFSSTSGGPNLFIENDQNLFYPNPAALDELRDQLIQAGVKQSSQEWNETLRDLLRRYEFLGRVIGKCLYEGILVDVGFAPFFLLKWALTGGTKAASRESSYRANMNDLRDLDEGLYQGLLQLKNYPGDVEDFSLNFTITDPLTTPRRSNEEDTEGGVSRTVTRDLRPNGSNIPVTNENRLFYISYVARHRLQVQPRAQTNAFLKGLGEIIQPEWLAMFNQSELQTLVGGESSEIDVEDLRRNTLYGGVYQIGDDREEHPSVKHFWGVIHSWSDSNRRKLLKFVTSTPRAPLLGFSQLNPPFSIRDGGSDKDRLPSASTCVNLLKLPQYGGSKILEEKLLYAIDAGAGFDLS